MTPLKITVFGFAVQFGEYVRNYSASHPVSHRRDNYESDNITVASYSELPAVSPRIYSISWFPSVYPGKLLLFLFILSANWFSACGSRTTMIQTHEYYTIPK